MREELRGLLGGKWLDRVNVAVVADWVQEHGEAGRAVLWALVVHDTYCPDWLYNRGKEVRLELAARLAS